MMTNVTALGERPAWKALEVHYKQIHKVLLHQMFQDDPSRGERFTL